METLNTMQKKAVTTTEGYLRVIAGAGSGKTKMLVNRYLYLVKDCGINPSNVICLTFSNKAASEMKKRIASLLGEDADLSFVTTYHGLGARIIRENVDKLFLAKNFVIIDRADQKAILKEIYDDLNLRLDQGSFEDVCDKIEIYKGDYKYIPQMINPSTTDIDMPINDQFDEVIKRYLIVQKKNHYIDFSDLINYAIFLLRYYQDVRDHWQERLNYILVDEFQDSTADEVELVDLISGLYKNLMVVGDPDQNIYEWRGSKMQYLVDFDAIHRPTETIVMDQNYRSTNKILTCANQLIACNDYRYPKDLYTLQEGGDDVIYYQAENDYLEAKWIINKIKELSKNEDCRLSQIAILYRGSFSSRLLEKYLMEETIPYEIIGNIKFFQRMEIKDVTAYLRLVINDDDYAFMRIVNIPKRQFGKMRLQKLKAIAGDTPLYKTLKENLKEFNNGEIHQFVKLIEFLRTNINNFSAVQIIDQILEGTGYEAYIRSLGDMDRLSNLAEFRRVIVELTENEKALSLDDCLAYIALQSDNEIESDDKVKLMTIHASKGLEFENVFVMNLTEGSFPSTKTIEERGVAGLEEERRLCYVAITRACKRLFLSSSNSFSTANESGKKPSRFLEEIGEENYVSINNKNKNDNKPIYKHKVGDTVNHRIFGKGKIVEIDYYYKAYKVLFENKLERPRSVRYDFNFEGDENIDTIIEDTVTKIKTETKEEEIPLNKENVVEELDFLIQDNNDNVSPYDFEDEQNEESNDELTYLFDEKVKISNDFKNVRTGLWDDPNIPKTGWICVGITDLGKPCGYCQMCTTQEVRYLHHMKHQDYPSIINVGCICAGKLEQNIKNAEKRENEFKNRLMRRKNFLNKKFKLSKKGNRYLKIDDDIFTVYEQTTTNKNYTLYINNERIPKTYHDLKEILIEIFNYVDNKKDSK